MIHPAFSDRALLHVDFPHTRIKHRMGSGRSSNTDGCVVGIIAASLAVSCIFSLVSGTHIHWVATIVAIVVGLMAVASINRGP